MDTSSVSFMRHKADMFQLQLTTKVNVMQQTCLATYKFTMEPISLERIDVLESKMRDLEEEIPDLRVKGATIASIQRFDCKQLSEGCVKSKKTIEKLSGDAAELSTTVKLLNGVVTSEVSAIKNYKQASTRAE